jgi:hypothetical protein
MLMAKSNMTVRMDRLDGIIMVPTKSYEANGEFKNCIFTNSLLKYRNRWWNHYGAGDRTVALALAADKGTNFLGPNRAKGKTVTASSSTIAVANAVDSNCATRWSSNSTDNEWISVDLGAQYSIQRVILRWETAYGADYKIQVSDNNTAWTDAFIATSGTGEMDDLVLPTAKAGRYVRMIGTKRGTTYGYSLWEIEVYGDPVVVVYHQAKSGLSGNLPVVQARGNSLRFNVPRAGDITVTILSAQGKVLGKTVCHASAGLNTLDDWALFRELGAGTYCVTIDPGMSGLITAKLLKTN